MIGIHKNSKLYTTTRHVASYEYEGVFPYGPPSHFYHSQLATWRIVEQNCAFLCVINITHVKL